MVDKILEQKSRQFRGISRKALRVTEEKSSSPRPGALTKQIQTAFFNTDGIQLDINDELAPDLPILSDLGYPNLTKFVIKKLKREMAKIPSLAGRKEYYKKMISKIQDWKDEANDRREGSLSASQSFINLESQEEEDPNMSFSLELNLDSSLQDTEDLIKELFSCCK